MDEQILELLFQRSESALELLARQFGHGLLRLTRNILTDQRSAEEAVSDTYLAVWNSIPPARPEPLAPYIYRIGRNIALKRRRHDSARKRAGQEVSLDELTEVLRGPTLEDTVSARDLGKAVDRWLGTLSRENRVIFLRRYWFGDDIPTIASLTGLKENAVSVRLNRLRSKLKDYLIREGFYE